MCDLKKYSRPEPKKSKMKGKGSEDPPGLLQGKKRDSPDEATEYT